MLNDYAQLGNALTQMKKANMEIVYMEQTHELTSDLIKNQMKNEEINNAINLLKMIGIDFDNFDENNAAKRVDAVKKAIKLARSITEDKDETTEE